MSFGERLRDAMLAAGVESTDHLARRCGVSRRVVMEWIASGGRSMSAGDLVALATALRVRTHWILNGDGPVTPRVGLTAEEADALIVLAGLPPETVPFWLNIGRQMTRRK